MPTKRYSTEQIISKLRQAEVEQSRGCLTARLPGFSPVQGRFAREASHATRPGDAVRSRRRGARLNEDGG